MPAPFPHFAALYNECRWALAFYGQSTARGLVYSSLLAGLL